VGVDLIPRNKQVEPFYSNWTGWRYIANLLVQLGFDISIMPFTNDGEYVNAKTAREWGNAILNALPKLYEVKVQDSLYAGGYRHEPLVLELDKEQEIAMLLKERSVVKPSENVVKWLKEFAEFCVNCRGFWVY